MLKRTLLAISLIFFSIASFANQSPTGSWTTYDDKTKDKSGIVNITMSNGVLYGTVTKIYPGGDRKPDGKCEKCPGKFKDKPVKGIRFLWGLKKTKENYWSGGKILDPKEGKIYTASAKLIDGGKKMQVRGYWGPFFRTQTWVRR